MHGLQTIQAINAAATSFSRQKSKTPVGDVIEGFYVFFPNGYEVIYHTAEKLPEHPDRPALSIEFKGQDCSGARFDVTPASGPQSCNRLLAEVAQIAAVAGVPQADVEKRLAELFIEASLTDEG